MTEPVHTATPYLENLAHVLSGRYVVTITPQDTSGQRVAYHRAKGRDAENVDNTDLLAYLAAQGRDFGAVSPAIERAVTTMLQAKVDELIAKALPLDGAIEVLGEGVLQGVARRFEVGGNDVPMRALRPSTVRRKGNDRIGVESNALHTGMKNANVRTGRG